jgi:predicted nuclease with RNAse H fold
MKMKVLGIDPAPSKKNVIFDGEKFYEKYNEKELKAKELKEYIKALSEDTLICWDAPLAFDVDEGDFYFRPIEKFFKYHNKDVLPKGISMIPIAGCPHWLMSQYVVGYPAINCQNNEISLITKKEDLQTNKLKIVEVHPALAIWIWLKDEDEDKNKNIKEWKYKKEKQSFEKILNILINEKIVNINILSKEDKEKLEKKHNDDYLDAYIAWKLGDMLINDPESVMLLGDESGCILLPKDEEIEIKFYEFKNN